MLGNLSAPDVDWDAHGETLREEIEGLVSGLLVLAGLDADPVTSREHILLANLIEHAWKQGLDLDLGALLMQIQDPPLRRLGVFELDTFFPAKDRMALAMRLNGLVAAPSFAEWLQGEPLEIDSLLRAPGRAAPRERRLPLAPLRHGAAVRGHAAPLEGGHLDAAAARHLGSARARVPRRGLRPRASDRRARRRSARC